MLQLSIHDQQHTHPRPAAHASNVDLLGSLHPSVTPSTSAGQTHSQSVAFYPNLVQFQEEADISDDSD